MDDAWLEAMYREAGLEPEEAKAAAAETLARLMAREHRPPGESSRRRITEALVQDPMSSVSRILGHGDLGLPFHDPETNRLSEIAVADAFAEVGMDPVVAMAYARVVVEMCEPADFYRPLWTGLGKRGEPDLGELARLDWTSLRTDRTVRVPSAPVHPEGSASAATEQSAGDTVVTPSEGASRRRPSLTVRPPKPRTR